MDKKCTNIRRRLDNSYLITIEFSLLNGYIKYKKKFQSYDFDNTGNLEWYTYPKNRFVSKSLIKFIEEELNKFKKEE